MITHTRHPCIGPSPTVGPESYRAGLRILNEEHAMPTVRGVATLLNVGATIVEL